MKRRGRRAMHQKERRKEIREMLNKTGTWREVNNKEGNKNTRDDGNEIGGREMV